MSVHRPTVAGMTATTVDSPRTTVGTADPRCVALDGRAVDQLLAGTGCVIEVERWPDEWAAGTICDDEGLREAAEDGLLSCYDVTLSTSSGAELARAVVWSTSGVACGPYTTCSALGAELADELAGVLGAALTRS